MACSDDERELDHGSGEKNHGGKDESAAQSPGDVAIADLDEDDLLVLELFENEQWMEDDEAAGEVDSVHYYRSLVTLVKEVLNRLGGSVCSGQQRFAAARAAQDDPSATELCALLQEYYNLREQLLEMDRRLRRRIPNSPFVCEHDLLSPFLAPSGMKRVSPEAWDRLYKQYGGGPTLSQATYCRACSAQLTSENKGEQAARKRRQEMLQLLQQKKFSGGYWISSAWLSEWRKNRTGENAPRPNINADIVCPHGELCIERGHRRVIPSEVWKYITEFFPVEKSGCVVFPQDTDTCAVCETAALLEKEKLDQERALRANEQKNHSSLYRTFSRVRSSARNQNSSARQVPPGEYCLVPLEWLETWYEYVSDHTVDRVPGVLNLTEFLCDHGLANIDPNITDDESDRSHERYYPVPLDSFAEFRRVYGGEGEIRYIVASAKLGSVITIQPGTCTECRLARVERERVAAFSYDTTVLRLEVARATGTRSRRATSKKYAEVIVSGTDTVDELRLKIYAAIDVPPYLQRIFKGDLPLGGETNHTLPELGIKANDTITVECLTKQQAQQCNASMEDHDAARGSIAEGNEAFENSALFSVIGAPTPISSSAGDSSLSVESAATPSEAQDSSPQTCSPVTDDGQESEPMRRDSDYSGSESDTVLSELTFDLKLVDRNRVPPRKHPRLSPVDVLSSDEEAETSSRAQ